jgi:hypothetical protein
MILHGLCILFWLWAHFDLENNEICKWTGWKNIAETILRRRSVTKHELESIASRLHHATFIIPLEQHLLWNGQLVLQNGEDDLKRDCLVDAGDITLLTDCYPEHCCRHTVFWRDGSRETTSIDSSLPLRWRTHPLHPLSLLADDFIGLLWYLPTSIQDLPPPSWNS